MKYWLIVASFWFFFFTNTAEAHLVTRPEDNTASEIVKSQTNNLSHARYVCNNGRRDTKTWHCKAKVWLRTELNQSQIKLQPTGMWYEIAACESGRRPPLWDIATGNGFYGGLQFDYGTWHEALANRGVYRGDPEWTEYAHQAPAWRQVWAAKTLPLTRWPHCGAPYR